jgi:hypothetical protein
VILIFVDAATVVGPGFILPEARAEDSEHEEVHADTRLTVDISASAWNMGPENPPI